MREKTELLSTKAEQLEWRRSKVTELRARGLSYTEIASELQVSRTSIAILASNGAATVPSYYSGSLNFAASQAAFHTLGGLPFTVTYTIDATAESEWLVKKQQTPIYLHS